MSFDSVSSVSTIYYYSLFDGVPHLCTGDPRAWTVAQVGQWLVSLGMATVVDKFQANEIDGMCLSEGLDDESLAAVGVTIPVHRKKIQTALAMLFHT